MTIRQIPFLDLERQHAPIADEINAAIAEVIREHAFISGRHVEQFESDFAAYCQAEHCSGVSNGTDALVLALRALGIGPGDEVLVPAMTFIATSEAVTLTGATPVFVDCAPEVFTICPALAEQAVTPRTKAIIAVHLYGRPAALEEIRTLADKCRLSLVQDCAQAHGARFQDKPLVSYGDICCYSFYPGKNLGAFGDAGAVVTNDHELARRMRMDANHGRQSKYEHEFEGMNGRLDGLQAAILSVKLKHLEGWVESRREIAETYGKLLQGVNGVSLPPTDGNRHVYHLFTLQAERRDLLREHLAKHGISTGIHYPIALPFQPAYQNRKLRPEDFPVAHACQEKALSLPFFPGLLPEEILYVCSTISQFYGNHSTE